MLFDQFLAESPADELAEVEAYLKLYMRFSFESLFNPQVYRDAGLSSPLEIRNRLLADPVRDAKEKYVFRKTLYYLRKTGIFSDDDLASATGQASS